MSNDQADAEKTAGDNTRLFKADKRYLMFPCSRGLAGKNRVFIDVDGRPYMSAYDTLIAGKNPDHWRWLDLKLMQGRTVSVRIEGPTLRASPKSPSVTRFREARGRTRSPNGRRCTSRPSAGG